MKYEHKAEHFDTTISDFKSEFGLTDKQIIKLMFGWIDFKLNSMGEIENKLRDVIKC